ncbi:PQQ-binding-like beta-propeller repeat protein [Uniformispora flossi]|uniref:outer membrane protein assembly factor BamB family protein n=1 Tax=Uniformispora flossi TaxID=3390723 RepID=UPI003C2CFA72
MLCLAFHPTLPLLAIGTGDYDGGYLFEGELLLLDLDSGRCVSALTYAREVRGLRWVDRCSLEVVVAPTDDYKDDEACRAGHTAVVVRDDWASVPDRSIEATELAGPRALFARPDERPEARKAVLDLSAGAGSVWSPRRQVWDVESLPDGRCLAVLDGVALECWGDGGNPLWALPDPEGGRQLHLCPDRNAAWVHVARRPRRGPSGWEERPSEVTRISLADGSTLGRVEVGYPVALTGCADGRFALRDTRHGRRASEPLRMFSAAGAETAAVEIGGYDVFNHYFNVRRSPELIVLQGDRQKPHMDKHVVAVREDQVNRLFALAWEARRHVFGDPAVWISDAVGQAVVHSGRIHDGAGLLRGNAAIVRRSFPDGAVRWTFTADHQTTALDTDGTTVFAAYNSGELVALDAATGDVRWRTYLDIDGHSVEPLSLCVTEGNRMLIGTTDGRIMDCSYSSEGAGRPGPSK